MKTATATLLFFLLAGAGLCQSTSTEPFSLDLSLKATAVKSGSVIKARVTLTNTSNDTLGIECISPERDYALTVLNSDGSPAPLTKLGRELKEHAGEMDIFRSILVELKVGETREDVVRISDLYDLRAPGEYTIQVSRVVPEKGDDDHDSSGNPVIKSNTATIVVSE